MGARSPRVLIRPSQKHHATSRASARPSNIAGRKPAPRPRSDQSYDCSYDWSQHRYPNQTPTHPNSKGCKQRGSAVTRKVASRPRLPPGRVGAEWFQSAAGDRLARSEKYRAKFGKYREVRCAPKRWREKTKPQFSARAATIDLFTADRPAHKMMAAVVSETVDTTASDFGNAPKT